MSQHSTRTERSLTPARHIPKGLSASAWDEFQKGGRNLFLRSTLPALRARRFLTPFSTDPLFHSTGRPGEYACLVPAEHLPAKWDFMYLIEVMDRAGNGAIRPDLEKGAPYVIVRLRRKPETK